MKSFRKFNLIILACFALFAASCTPQQTDEGVELTEEELMKKAEGIHERVITLDTHDDINTNNFVEDRNYSMDLDNQVTLPKMEKGGLDVAWFVVYTGQGELNDEGYAKAYENAMDKFTAIHRLAEEIAPDRIELAYTSNDVREIVASGKKVAMIGIENGYPIGMDISNVKKFAELGGRYMSLSHNGHSQLSDSNTGERDSVWLYNGLSDLGKEVIGEMNKWGMMIDVSHPSKEAMRDMIELTKAPIIASHSASRAMNDHSRNLDDEQLMWLKENGGVVQTVAFSNYVNSEKHVANRNAWRAVEDSISDAMGFERMSRSEVRKLSDEEIEVYMANYEEMRRLAKPLDDKVNNIAPPVDVADFVDHIDYMVDLIGLDHVGISSDFDGGGGVYGWNDASETFNVTLELVRRGYTEEEIGQLWSGNLLRVLDDVQRVAAEIQAAE
jgi:membrane dipeptidase